MAESRTKRQTAPNPDHEQQPLDETVAQGEHMDLDLNDAALDAERRAGAPAPTGVILPSPSTSMNPNVSEEMQGMEMLPKTFGPPQYGSPDPATAASRLMTLEDGHPLAGLPEDHPAALSEDYAVEIADPGTPVDAREVDATDSAREYAHEHGIDLSTVQGTGSGGRITQQDVKDVHENSPQREVESEPQRQDVKEVPTGDDNENNN